MAVESAYAFSVLSFEFSVSGQPDIEGVRPKAAMMASSTWAKAKTSTSLRPRALGCAGETPTACVAGYDLTPLRGWQTSKGDGLPPPSTA